MAWSQPNNRHQSKTKRVDRSRSNSNIPPHISQRPLSSVLPFRLLLHSTSTPCLSSMHGTKPCFFVRSSEFSIALTTRRRDAAPESHPTSYYKLRRSGVKMLCRSMGSSVRLLSSTMHPASTTPSHLYIMLHVAAQLSFPAPAVAQRPPDAPTADRCAPTLLPRIHVSTTVSTPDPSTLSFCPP